MVRDMGYKGGLIYPRPWSGQYRAGFSNTGGSPKPRKRAPCQKNVVFDLNTPYLTFVSCLAGLASFVCSFTFRMCSLRQSWARNYLRTPVMWVWGDLSTYLQLCIDVPNV